MTKTKELVDEVKGLGLFLFIGIAIGIVFTIILCFALEKEDNSSSPVEETIVKVDSIIQINDSLKIKVEQLDSIKNAKVVEVQALDNDSTVKLFYELISK